MAKSGKKLKKPQMAINRKKKTKNGDNAKKKPKKSENTASSAIK